MNIIYIGAFRLPNFDAAAPRVLNNARAMTLCGHEVSFISWGGKLRESDKGDDGIYRIDGMRYIITGELDLKGSVISRLYNALRRGDKTMKLLKEMSPKPDVIIMYNSGYGFTKSLLSFCKKYDIKLVNDLTEWYDNKELRFWDIIPNYLNMLYLQKKVKNKICISSYLNKYYDESNNIVVPPLCDFSEPKWMCSINDERIQAFDGITLIYAGNPAKKDSVHTIINVVNKLAFQGKSIRFVILGISREDYLSNYSDFLHVKSLHHNILFLGRLSQDLVPAYYKKADFMVLLREPNRKSMAGFPTKFAESMVAGVPVIANITSDLCEYLIDEKTGFIVGDNSSKSLEITLEKVLNITRERLQEIKKNVAENNQIFDYKYRVYDFDLFLNSLR